MLIIFLIFAAPFFATISTHIGVKNLPVSAACIVIGVSCAILACVLHFEQLIAACKPL